MGARISTSRSGTNKQDYRTPDAFMKAVVQHFGPISFDLAADASNAQSPHYFAPSTSFLGPMPFDPNAHAMDAFDHSWAELSNQREPNGASKGLLWLNPPFAEIAEWSSRCRNEAMLGANILLLVPAAVGSDWFVHHVAGFADIYLLTGRLSFIPGQPYNKDCMLAHYQQSKSHRQCTRVMVTWDWRQNRITHQWDSLPRGDE